MLTFDYGLSARSAVEGIADVFNFVCLHGILSAIWTVFKSVAYRHFGLLLLATFDLVARFFPFMHIAALLAVEISVTVFANNIGGNRAWRRPKAARARVLAFMVL